MEELYCNASNPNPLLLSMRLSEFIKAPRLGDSEHFHQACSLHCVLWTVLVVVTVMCIFDIVTLPENAVRWVGLVVFLDSTLLLLIYMNHRGRTRIGSIIAVIAFWVMVTVL